VWIIMPRGDLGKPLKAKGEPGHVTNLCRVTAHLQPWFHQVCYSEHSRGSAEPCQSSNLPP
jgi:hypothetical protein